MLEFFVRSSNKIWGIVRTNKKSNDMFELVKRHGLVYFLAGQVTKFPIYRKEQA
jgi:hypothetical protein